MSSAFPPGSTDRRPRVPGPPTSAQELVARQKEQFGGLKFGSTFFGWLTATAMIVLLTGLLAAVVTALGLAGRVGLTGGDPAALGTVALVGGVTFLVVILLAYFCGGYVAARMARFAGLKQGLGVWLWALVAAVVLAAVGYLVAGGGTDLVGGVVDGIPAVPADALSSGGLIAAVALALISLVGALLGGLAGLRYHRRVDRAGFEDY